MGNIAFVHFSRQHCLGMERGESNLLSSFLSPDVGH